MNSKFADQKYDISVYDPALSRDGMSEDGLITSGCYVFVYTAGSKTLATIYSSPLRASLANPITRSQFATDDRIKFYGAASSYDLVIADDKGNIGTYPGVTPNVHSLALNRSSADKCLVFPMVFNAGGTETDTGLDLPLKALVTDVGVEVVTTDATETVAIGLLSSETAGDADGLLEAVSVANAGYLGGFVATVGSNETYISSAKFGALMGKGSAGTDAANDFGQPGGAGHFVTGSNATSITYTPSSSDTFAGYGFVYFKVVR
jgi:hypothetical protein